MISLRCTLQLRLKNQMKKFINDISLARLKFAPQNIKSIGATIVAIASICMLAFLISKSSDVAGKISDFPEYYAPAKMIADGNGANSYILTKLGEEQHSLFSGMGNRVVALFVPPQGLALISAIGMLNVAMAIMAWKVFLVGCLIVAIIFLISTFSLNYKQTCYLIAGLCLSYPCYEALRLGQLAPILLLSFSAAIYFLQKNKNIAAGLCLSLLIILKPQQIFPFLAYLAGLRRWRALTVLMGMFILFTLIAFFEIGTSGFQNYFALGRSPESAAYMQPELNATLRGQLMRLMPAHSNMILDASIVIYAIVLAFSYLYGQQTRDKPDTILRGVLSIIPIGLVTSLHCHDYDLLLLVPSLIVIFTERIVPFNSLFQLLLIFAGIPFLLPLAINIHYDYLLHGGKINILFLELAILSLTIIYRVCQVSQKIDTKVTPK